MGAEDDINAVLAETQDVEPLDTSGSAWSPQKEKKTEEVPAKVIEYIKSQKSEGKSEDDIRQALIKQGWDSDVIEKAFIELSPKKEAPSSGTKVVSEDTSLIKKELNLLKAKVEKLESFNRAEKEFRKNNSERFERSSERIGSLVESQRDLEKSLAEVRTTAEKASDIVENLEPTKIEERFHKRKAKIEELGTRFSTNSDKIDQLRSQIKELVQRTSQFVGIEALDKMKEDVRTDLTTTKKLQAKVEKDANKVEDMFYEVENKHKEILDLKTRNKELEKDFRKVEKEFDNIRVKQQDLVRRKELDDFRTLEKDKWSDILGEIGVLKQRVHDYAQQAEDIRKMGEMLKSMKGYFTDINLFERLKKEFEREVISNEKSTETMYKLISDLNEKISDLKAQLRGIKRNKRYSKLKGMFKGNKPQGGESYDYQIYHTLNSLNESISDLKSKVTSQENREPLSPWDKWVAESMRRGASPQYLKLVLSKMNMDPRIVDRYLYFKS